VPSAFPPTSLLFLLLFLRWCLPALFPWQSALRVLFLPLPHTWSGGVGQVLLFRRFQIFPSRFSGCYEGLNWFALLYANPSLFFPRCFLGLVWFFLNWHWFFGWMNRPSYQKSRYFPSLAGRIVTCRPKPLRFFFAVLFSSVLYRLFPPDVFFQFVFLVLCLLSASYVVGAFVHPFVTFGMSLSPFV